MGYYSEVALALTRKGVEILDENLNNSATPEKTRKETRDLLTHADRHFEANGSEIWYWKFIKWYIDEPEYFPEVDFIIGTLAKMKEHDYRFMRIGENYDDTEIMGDYCDDPFDLTLCRRIQLENAG